MPANDSAYLTAMQFKELLASGRVSALELLKLHLARVAKLNPAYNAVVALDEEGARQQARKADDVFARGIDLGPLHGIPMTIKDTFEVTGMPATCGPIYGTERPSTTSLRSNWTDGSILATSQNSTS
jgi:amidase